MSAKNSPARPGKLTEKKKVVYLFGAGATHAELANICEDKMSDATFLARNSLLLSDVSKRVCREAKRDRDFAKRVHSLLSKSGLANVELFIGLLEKNRVKSIEKIVRVLKTRMRRDIQDRVLPRRKQFYLHRALLEFHKVHSEEKLTGIVSLNYDRVIDEAYADVLGVEPDYCLSVQGERSESVPLLKLHGGFDLLYRQKRLPFLTPGVNKNYLELPYSFVWGRALELLLDCDVLRVIGCSLSQNDIGIVDLIFKAHIVRDDPFLIQIVDFDPKSNRIRENFGFFPHIESARKIDGGLISDVDIEDPTTGSNPFKIWLKAKIRHHIAGDTVKSSKYLKKVLA